MPTKTTASSRAKPKRRLQMSFGGCGFLGVYHAGVGKCVCDHAPHLFQEFEMFYGASAGAICAASAACKSDPMEAYKWVKKTFEASRKYTFGMLHPSFDLYDRLRNFLDKFLPRNAHRLCRNKVTISLSTFNDRGAPVNWLVSDFNTRKELINVIIASSFIPGYAGFKDLPKFRGRRCFDGGFTSNIPFSSDSNVITVSPFSGACDICPQGESCSPHVLHWCDQPLQLSSTNMHRLMTGLLPSSWEQLEELFYRGYDDALRFFRLEGLIPKPVVKPRRMSSTLSDLSTLEDMPPDCNNPLGMRTHSRSQSMALSFSSTVSSDYQSCVEDPDDFKDLLDDFDASGGLIMRDGRTPHPNSLVQFPGNRFDTIQEELEGLGAEGEVMEKDRESGRRSSLSVAVDVVMKRPLGAVKASWKGLSWMLHSCCPPQVPLVHRLHRALNQQPHTQQHISGGDDDTHSWDELQDGGLFRSIVASWSSSMVVF